MKANEAPEKLYLHHNLSHPAGKRYLNMNKMSDNDIEYTRTDAFIEKAIKWLDDNIWAYIEIMHPTVDSYTRINNERLILDFKKVMRQ